MTEKDYSKLEAVTGIRISASSSISEFLSVASLSRENAAGVF